MKIEHFRPCDKGGSLKASFQAVFYVEPWGAFCLNMTFFQKDNGQSWFGYPQREYVNQEGQKKYFKLAYPDENGRANFEKDVKEALVQQVPVMRDILGISPQNVSAQSQTFSHAERTYQDEQLPF